MTLVKASLLLMFNMAIATLYNVFRFTIFRYIDIRLKTVAGIVMLLCVVTVLEILILGLSGLPINYGLLLSLWIPTLLCFLLGYRHSTVLATFNLQLILFVTLSQLLGLPLIPFIVLSLICLLAVIIRK